MKGNKRIDASKKMKPDEKKVQGPLDDAPRVRGGKAGKSRRYLPLGHVSRTHDQ